MSDSWSQFLIFIATFLGVYLAYRSSKREDIAMMNANLNANMSLVNAQLIAMREETKEFHRNTHEETKEFHRNTHEEMKDFHGRLCAIEERRMKGG